jgi:hypothetical protein
MRKTFLHLFLGLLGVFGAIGTASANDPNFLCAHPGNQAEMDCTLTPTADMTFQLTATATAAATNNGQATMTIVIKNGGTACSANPAQQYPFTGNGSVQAVCGITLKKGQIANVSAITTNQNANGGSIDLQVTH